MTVPLRPLLDDDTILGVRTELTEVTQKPVRLGRTGHVSYRRPIDEEARGKEEGVRADERERRDKDRRELELVRKSKGVHDDVAAPDGFGLREEVSPLYIFSAACGLRASGGMTVLRPASSGRLGPGRPRAAYHTITGAASSSNFILHAQGWCTCLSLQHSSFSSGAILSMSESR
jgi:hypothetical protein